MITTVKISYKPIETPYIKKLLLEISEAAYRFLEYSSDFERSLLFFAFAFTEAFSRDSER